MNNIVIRRATIKDCERLLELVQELADYEKAPNEVTVTLAHFTNSGFGENPLWWAFVATTPSKSGDDKREEIHGFALYYIRYSTWKGQRMYLEDILVTNEMRNKGVGKRLFNALIEEAKAKQLNGIVWQVLRWNEPAIHFYKKCGANFDPEWINCCLEIK